MTSVAVAATMAVGSQLHGALREQFLFAIATTVLFIFLSITLFFAGKKTATSKHKLAFNHLVLSSVFGKMLLSLVWLLIYRYVAQPNDNWYIVIFLFIYGVFTVFEVIFMSKLARLESAPDAEQ